MKYSLTLLFLLPSLLTVGQIETIDSLTFIKIIETNIDTFKKDHNIPGAIISVVKDGKPFYTSGIGYENIEANKKVDTLRSQFRVASITKTFTALAIMQLVEQGKLELHADVRTYLDEEEYPWDAPYSFTIHDLLTHTTGMEHSAFRASQAAKEARSLDLFVKTSISNQIFKPGEIFFYSNKGYGILGLLIEKMSGIRYEDYVERFILHPMGMSHSTLYQHSEQNPIDNPVQPYYWDGEFKKRDRRYLVNPAASTLNTTGIDMAKFMAVMLDSAQVNGKSIISKASFELMTSRQFAPPVDFESMGYGMMIEEYKGVYGYNHGGGIDGFGSYYIFFPELDLGIFMSQSGGEENAAYAFRVIYAILGTIIEEQELHTSAKVPLDVAIRQAEKYSGQYQLATVTKSTFERGQMLFGINEPVVKHVGDGVLSYGNQLFEPVDHDTYKAIDGKRKIGFTSGHDGRVKYMSERLYWTFEKINWWQSAMALRIALALSLVLLTIGVIIRPLVFKFKFGRMIRWKSLLTLSFFLLVAGFGILLLGYALDISLTFSTPLIYKAGIWMTTLGAFVAIFYPVELWTRWKSFKRKDLMWTAFNLLGLALLLASYWRVNLIGFHYY